MAEQDSEQDKDKITQQDGLEETLTVPANKLDADEYNADDLDGVSESIFGSGNMSFASLQASQSEEGQAINTGSIYPPSDNSNSLEGGGSGQQNGSQGDIGKDAVVTDTDRPIDQEGDLNEGSSITENGGFVTGTIGSVGASQLSSNAGAFSGSGSGLSIGDALKDISDESDSEVINNNNGNSVTNIEETTSTTTVINNDPPDVNIVNNAGDVISGDIIHNVGDVIGDLTENINNLNTTVNNILNNSYITEVLNPTEILEIVNNHLTTVVEQITETEQIITDTVTIIDNSVDTVIENTFEIVSEEITNIHETTTEVFNFVKETIHELETTIETIIETVGGPDIINIEQVLGDTITIINNKLTSLHEIVINKTETIIETLIPGQDNADTDITLGLTGGNGDINTGSLLDVVEDVAGDLDLSITDGDGLFGDGETDNSNGDSDITLDLIADVADNDLIEDELGIGLDPVEELVGDIDIDIDLSLDALGDRADDLVNDEDGGTGEDTILAQIGDAAEDIADDIMDNVVNDLLGDDDSGGDTDVSLDLAGDTLVASEDTGELLDVVEDVVGDVDLSISGDDDLLGDSETDNAEGDSDLVLSLDGDIADNDIVGDDIEISLDPVEDITGDLDLDVALGADALGDQADNLVDGDDGGTGDNTILAQVGDAAEDVADEIIDNLIDDNSVEEGISEAIDLLGGNDEGDSDGEGGTWTEDLGGLGDDIFGAMLDADDAGSDELPDPSSTVAEGLGQLDVEPEATLGGLFG